MLAYDWTVLRAARGESSERVKREHRLERQIMHAHSRRKCAVLCPSEAVLVEGGADAVGDELVVGL